METISVIVPGYNHAEYIEPCLDSPYFQDYENLEIIVVDDCSTDGSRDVINRWLANRDSEETSFAAYSREKTGEVERKTHKRYEREGRSQVYLATAQNMDSTRPCNRGFQSAPGEFFMFVVSNDMRHSQMLTALSVPLR